MKEISTIGVYTQLLRNESTATIAIQSVLNQTYKDFTYYILVSDETINMVIETIKKDERVVLLFDQKAESFINFYKTIAEKHKFVFCLDADDWISNDCFEKMLTIALKEDIDITICGNTFFYEDTIIGYRKSDNELILEKKDALVSLCNIYQFFRVVWGKLFRSSILLKKELAIDTREYGSDTKIIFTILQDTRKIGILQMCLYNYRVGENSISTKITPNREKGDADLYLYVLDILRKNNADTKKNKSFLLLVYANALIDTLGVLKRNYKDDKLISSMYDAIQNPITSKFLFYEKNNYFALTGFLTFGDRVLSKKLRDFLDICIERKKNQREEIYMKYFEIFLLLCPEYSEKLSLMVVKYALHNDKLIKALLNDNLKVIQSELLQEIKNNSERENKAILDFLISITEEPLLMNIFNDSEYVKKNLPIVLLIVFDKLEEAKNECVKIIEKKISNEYEETLKKDIELLLNLTALTNDVERFIDAKVLKYKWLMNNNENDMAKQELDDLKEMGVEI